jgi:hypothetical protein
MQVCTLSAANVDNEDFAIVTAIAIAITISRPISPFPFPPPKPIKNHTLHIKPIHPVRRCLLLHRHPRLKIRRERRALC